MKTLLTYGLRSFENVLLNSFGAKKYFHIFPSKKKRKLYLLSCFTTLGEASNNLLFLKKNYKAGNSR